MIDSPYVPGFGARPVVMVGREAQLSRAGASLSRVANAGAAAPSVMVLIGTRGIGKTVTLAAIADDARARGFATAEVVFDSVSDTVRLVAARVAAAVAPYEREGRLVEGWRRIRSRLESLSIEVSAGIVRVGREPSEGGTPAREIVQDRDVLTALLVEGAQAVLAGGGTGLVLLVDELQEAQHDHLVVLANALQTALSAGAGAPLAVFAAGLPSTPERVTAAASFTERFDFRVLGRLSEDAAQRALLEPALQAGVSWDPPAADRVVEAAGGSPYLIQKIGDEAWLAASPERGAVVGGVAVDVALAETSASLAAGMFRGRWTKATPAEQAVMAAVAHVQGHDGVALSRDISEALGRTTPQWSVARKGLIDKGLVEAVGIGRLNFTMPGFAAFVRDMAGLGSRGTLERRRPPGIAPGTDA